MTEIVAPLTVGLADVLAKADVTLTEALDVVAPIPAAPVSTTPLAGNPELPDEAEQAVLRLPSILRDLRDSLPSEWRQLTEDELYEIVVAYIDLTTTYKAVDAARRNLKKAIFNHFDAKALQDGRIRTDTPRTGEGWAVLPDDVSGVVDGLDQKVVREVSGGKPTVTEESLKRAIATPGSGLTHEDYLAMTRQTREIDQDRVMRWIRDNPRRAQESLKLAITRTRADARLALRPNK